MAQKRKTQSARTGEARQAAEKSSQPRAPKPGGESKDVRALRFEQDLWQNLDRINQVVAKSIDLAEASLALGVRMVGNLGKVGQEHLLRRVMGTGATAAQQADTAQADPYAQPAAAPEAAAVGPAVVNRAPLHPGSDVYLPFSLTNDSPDTAKAVRLSLQGLAGEAAGGRIPAETLRIAPPEARLAPLDFEKFIITGRIPGETVPDTYVGAILVDGEERLAIPLRLAVI